MVDRGERAAPRQRLIVILVVACFVLPVLAAWWLAVVDPPRTSGHLLNHGELITPPMDVRDDPVFRILDALDLAPGEWAMILYRGTSCTEPCQRVLATLLTVRTLLGNDGSRLTVAALLAAHEPLPARVTPLVDSAAQASLAARLGPDRAEGIVFFDWRGQIMLRFPLDAPPADIKADIKRLLRASKLD